MRPLLYWDLRGCIGRSARRSFLTTPPLPPAPAATDAGPFFKTVAKKHTSGTSSSQKSPTASTRTTITRTLIQAEADTPRTLSSAATPCAGRDENDSENSLHNNANINVNSKHTCRGGFSNAASSESVEQTKEGSHGDVQHHHNVQRPSFFSPETFAKHVPKPAKFAASLVADALNLPPRWDPTPKGSGEVRQEYREHCVLGWSPLNLYHVVADVAQYSTFLPWCLDSIVHHVKRLDGDEAKRLLQEQPSNNNSNHNTSDNNKISSTNSNPMEMLATLTVGFSFFKEKYTSQVFLLPGKKVQAVLNEGGSQRRNPVLSDLHCVWEFNAVPGNEQQVEVRFIVSFAFKNPLHSKFIMSHVVCLMMKSFEKHCEKLYGPPSCEHESMRSGSESPIQQEQGDTISVIAQLEANSELMTLFFRHIAVCPPHGPFKYYSALTFAERVRMWLAAHTSSDVDSPIMDEVTPTAVLQLMEKYYNTQHLRSWPLLYVPAEIRLKDVDALINGLK